jgi:uncharacterized hydrophobic protein (TIGR00271 family)
MNERDPALGTRAERNPIHQWWRRRLVGTVDHHAVVEKVHEEARWSGHYVFMTLMSAGIAMLGLLLSSPAVVIGAMLISPLMGPIVGFGFGLATFDFSEVRKTLVAIAVGVALAVGFSALIVLSSPIQTVTDEIAARTRPNLFDLMVALFSGLAGTYAMIRGRHGTIVGVAIATALMPPLSVIGFGIATWNATVFFGALLLFLTNLMTIGASAAVLARIYGFGHQLSPRQGWVQATLIVGIFVALAIPLGLALRQIAWETVASHQSREVIAAQFGPLARLHQIDINYDREPIRISATVFTPEYRRSAEQDSERALAATLLRPVEVNIDQYQVGVENGDVEAAQVSAARGGASEQGAARVAERLALVAGVDPGEVIVDRGARRARVRAAQLAGADLAAYQALERRVAGFEPRWNLVLVPPPVSLPDVSFTGGEPDEEGLAAMEIAVWAARRLQLPIGVSAADPTRAELIAEALRLMGAETEIEPPEGVSDGPVLLRWLAPRVR